MATQAHCAYCFESLSASLEKRHPLTLRETEALWKQYNADPSDDVQQADADPELEPSDSELEDTDADAAPARPAAISRLLAPSPSTASSSSVQSVSSTPSGVSEASSATSKSSSRSSFFSLGRKKRKAEDGYANPGTTTALQDGEVEDSPLFVTWNVVTKSGEKRLRGCIGTFEAQDLSDGLRSYALTSAFDDTRFLPIPLRELPTLECGVTLLTNFEPIASPLDWDIGTHGLRISFSYHNRRYGSTYLPDVAREQGWTKEETLVSLMRKAGWSGKREDWRKVELSVVRYQGRQVKLGYKEWREWRDWVEETGR